VARVTGVLTSHLPTSSFAPQDKVDYVAKLSEQGTAPDVVRELASIIEPAWALEPHVCPDYWTKIMYSAAEGRVHCRYPADVTKVGNPKCLVVAKFPENYNRRDWARLCGVQWQGVTYSSTAMADGANTAIVPKWAQAKNACPDGWTRYTTRALDLLG
jgi:hypothetical protein